MVYTPELSFRHSRVLRPIAWAIAQVVDTFATTMSGGKTCKYCKDNSFCKHCPFNPSNPVN